MRTSTFLLFACALAALAAASADNTHNSQCLSASVSAGAGLCKGKTHTLSGCGPATMTQAEVNKVVADAGVSECVCVCTFVCVVCVCVCVCVCVTRERARDRERERESARACNRYVRTCAAESCGCDDGARLNKPCGCPRKAGDPRPTVCVHAQPTVRDAHLSVSEHGVARGLTHGRSDASVTCSLSSLHRGRCSTPKPAK